MHVFGDHGTYYALVLGKTLPKRDKALKKVGLGTGG